MRHLARAGLLLLLGCGCPVHLPIDGVEITGSGATTDAAVCEPPIGAPGQPLVVTAVGGAGHHHVHAVAHGDAGETYIAGYFTDTIALQGAPIDGGEGTSSAFVARLDCAGALDWLNIGRTADAGSASTGLAIAVHDGRVLVGGSIGGSVEFTGGSVTGTVSDAFIARFDAADGTLQGSTTLPGETEEIKGLAIAEDGTIHAVGGCKTDRTGVLIATWSGLDEPGVHHCAYTDANASTTTARSVVLLPDGSPVIAGQLTGPIVGLHDPMIEDASSRGFVVKPGAPLDLADPFAAVEWSITFGRGAFTGNRVDALAVRGGEIVLAARGVGLTQVQGTGDAACGLDECEAMGFQEFNTAVARLDPDDGACLGARVLCSDSVAAEEAWAIAASDDKLFVTGQFEGRLLYDDQDLVPAPQYTSVRMFVLSLEPDLARAPDDWTLLSDAEGDTECGFVSPKNSDTRSIVRGLAIAAGPDGVLVGGSLCGPGLSIGGVTFTPDPMRYHGFAVKLAR